MSQQSMRTNHTQAQSLGRWSLLGLILCAYARLVWELDAKNLWWDESLSLQRAESTLPDLLRGVLWIKDGLVVAPTFDQHPFLYFLIQTIFVSGAGISEFSLRYASVIAATLLVPMLWTCGHCFYRWQMMPATAPMWAAFFGAISPFYLWYGQEARPYALWAFLTLLSIYLLVRALWDADQFPSTPSIGIAESRGLPNDAGLPSKQGLLTGRFWWLLGYGLVLLASLTTHFFAAFLIPVHALMLLIWLMRRSWLLGILTVGAGLLAVAGASWYVARLLLGNGGGINFSYVAVDILLRDLLNAFSLGPSADVGQPWVLGLDILFGLLALLGMIWAVRMVSLVRQGSWLIPALVIVPICVLLAIQTVRPVYMNARHMSLIGGGFLLATGSGLGLIWQRQRWVAAGLALLLLLGCARSTVDYFIQEEYAKDDFESLGTYFSERVLPGDAVLVNPTFAWRQFDYYLPIPELRAAQAAGAPVVVYGVPLIGKYGETEDFLLDLSQQHNRIWMVTSGTFPFLDTEGNLEKWLANATAYQMIGHTVFSHSTLRANLYYSEVPVYNEPLADIPNPVDVTFGDLIRLIGYDVAPPISPAFHTPLTLYWQIDAKTDKRYKYLITVEENVGPESQSGESQSIDSQSVDGDPWRGVVKTERQPFDGWISTDLWHPGQTFLESGDLAPVPGVDIAAGLQAGTHRLTVELYNIDSLEKLPVTHAVGETVGEIDEDGASVPLLFK